MKKISIVMPVYNEEEILEVAYEKILKLIQKLKNYAFELIYVNDGSEDNSLKILKEIAQTNYDVKIVNFSRNFGSQSAIIAGLREVTGESAVIIDADLQDPVEVIPQMISLWEQGNDIVYGKRKKRKGEKIFKILSAKIFYWLLNVLSDTKIPKDTGEFRLVDKKVIKVINSLPEHNKFLRGLFAWCGFKQIAIEYERVPRNSGKSKFTLRKMLNLAKDGIFSFSTKPIEIIGKLGIFSILLSFGLMIYSIIGYILNSNNLIRGWTSIIVSITFFSGVQLMSLWIISQYIQRIYEESKNRPNYIVKEKINIEK